MWAIVEIMGHRIRAGLVSDATIGGATMLRVEHPTAATPDGGEPVTEYYAPQAIFAIRPCTQEDAARVAGQSWPAGQPRPQLAYELEVHVDDDDDDDDFTDDWELD